MAKVTAPLLSFGGSGTIGKAVTFSRWKGRPYARQRVVPSNPQTVEQTLTRTPFANASRIWKAAPSLFVDPWNRFAQGQVLTGRNAMMGQFVATLREALDLSTMIFSPGAKGGTPADSLSALPSPLELQVLFTVPEPPTGWTLTSVVAAAIPDDSPQIVADAIIVADLALAPILTVTLSNLKADTPYIVGGWPVWEKPDGSVAYGPSINATASTPA